MPKLHEMIESKFLKKEDVDPPRLFTIRGLNSQNVAKEGADPEMKWTMQLEEADKPFVLNSTNLQMIANICGSDDSDDWPGKQIVLYNDPNVSFGGKLTGGIRVRKPKNSQARTVTKMTAKVEDLDDDVPF